MDKNSHNSSSYINTLKDYRQNDPNLIGSRAVDFAQIYNSTDKAPKSFVVSSIAFDDFLITADLIDPILDVLKDVKPYVRKSAEEASGQIANIIMSATMPAVIQDHIADYYKYIGGRVANPFVSVQSSNVIDSKFIPSTSVDKVFRDVRGIDDLITKIKLAWLNLFSTEAIELRTNGYYEGPLTIAVLIQKMIRSEISGKAYSIPPITKEQELCEVYAVYGLQDAAVDMESMADSYKIDTKSKKIIEKNIIPQEYMVIRKGRSHQEEIMNLTVEISKEWQKRQKIEDTRILEITESVLEIEAKLNKPVIVTWGLEAGKLYTLDVEEQNVDPIIRPLTNIDEKEFLKKYNVDVHPEADEHKKEKPDLDELEKEINNLVSGHTPLDSRKKTKQIEYRRQKQTLEYPKWAKDFDLKTKILFEITQLNTNNLSISDLFDGVFFDGTELILNYGILPESIHDDAKAWNQLKESFSIEIATAAKNAGKNPFYYQFSNITEFEYGLLGLETTDKDFEGDERFIEDPNALIFEAQAIKNAINEFNCNNINLIFPSIRNLNNLKDLKKVINSQDLQRSSNHQFLVDISVPSLANEIMDLDDGLIDGVIINYDTLLRLSVYRNRIREVDHFVMSQQIGKIKEKLEKKGIQVIVRIDEISHTVIRNMLANGIKSLLFNNMPLEVDMEYIAELEGTEDLKPEKNNSAIDLYTALNGK